MKHTRIMLVLTVLVTALLLAGCGKKAAEVVQGARAVHDAQDGEFTVTDEEGGKVHVKSNIDDDSEGGKMTVNTDKGTVTTETGKDVVNEKDVGIAFYPGAEVETGISHSSEDGGHARGVSLNTADSLEKVAEFYKSRYSKGNQVVEHPTGLMIMIETGEKSGAIIMATREASDDYTGIFIQTGGSN